MSAQLDYLIIEIYKSRKAFVLTHSSESEFGINTMPLTKAYMFGTHIQPLQSDYNSRVLIIVVSISSICVLGGSSKSYLSAAVDVL